MKHPWSLGPQPECFKKWMQLCLKNNRHDKKIAKYLLFHTQKIESQLPKTLYKMFMRGLYLYMDNPCRYTEIFLTELCGAYEFKHVYPSAGNLSKFYKALESDSRLAHYVVEKCNALEKETWENGFQWFKLRVMVMDIVTADLMLKSTSNWNVFYGGDSHARSIVNILSLNGSCHKNNADLLDYIRHEVKSCNTIKNNNKKYVIMGEAHTETRLEFAEKLLDFCNQHCYDSKEEIGVFIEKHPSNGKDKVQQMLTCNLQSVQSIQKFRCNYPTCPNVKVHDIDVRHSELGFLRYEILSLDKDPEFSKLSRQFQSECLTHIKSIATVYM